MKQWEYYCHGCKQLRLYVSRKEEKPCKCARCSSENIQIGEIGCPELTKLRYGNDSELSGDFSIEFYS